MPPQVAVCSCYHYIMSCITLIGIHRLCGIIGGRPHQPWTYPVNDTETRAPNAPSLVSRIFLGTL